MVVLEAQAPLITEAVAEVVLAQLVGREARLPLAALEPHHRLVAHLLPTQEAVVVGRMLLPQERAARVAEEMEDTEPMDQAEQPTLEVAEVVLVRHLLQQRLAAQVDLE